MDPRLKKEIEKLAKHNRRMYAAEIAHAEKTGVRHYPDKKYFKELRKQKKLLSSMALEDIRFVLHELHKVSDALTRPRQLKTSFIERASRDEAIEMVLSMRYLHEFLDEILEKNEGAGPVHL